MTNRYKGLKAILLSLLLIFALSACSGVSDDVQPDNRTDAPSRETSNADSKKTDDILKGYYYAEINQPIVDFELEDLNGNKVKLSDYKGKIVFLNFWATWCPPCREEMPFMQEFYEKYKDDDIIVLTVNSNITENQGLDDSEKAERKAREFIQKNGYTFPVLLDKDDSVWAVYQQRGIPANYVIDKEGIIRFLKPGAFTDLEEMEAFAKAAGTGA